MNLLKDYKKRFEEAVSRKYLAAMFDVDGTLKPIGYQLPFASNVADFLRGLCLKMPLAFGTARPLKTALPQLKLLLGDQYELLRAHWTLICENGCVGYIFDQAKGEFVELYKVEWPEPSVAKGALIEALHAGISDDLAREFSVNETSINVLPYAFEGITADELTRRVDVLGELVYAVLCDFPQAAALHVGNSRMGISILPHDGDKDHGAREFCRYLQGKKGLRFDDRCSELIVIGDNPLPGGNDHYFLNGGVGTAFTVGAIVEGAEWPLPVFAEDGRVLHGAEGTVEVMGRMLQL